MCSDLDYKLNSADYDMNNPRQPNDFYYRNNYTKCVSKNAIIIENLKKITDETDLKYFDCASECVNAENITEGYMCAVMKDDHCFCGDQDLFNKTYIETSDKCNKCPFDDCLHLLARYCQGTYSPDTCGTSDEDTEEMYSVYCSVASKCQIYETTKFGNEKAKEEAEKFNKKPEILSLVKPNITETGAECLNLCKESKSVYLKQKNDPQLECICQDNPNISITWPQVLMGFSKGMFKKFYKPENENSQQSDIMVVAYCTLIPLYNFE